MREKQLPNARTTPSRQEKGFLAQGDIFKQLQPTELNELERITTMTTCPPGRILYRPGDAGTALFLLTTGNVQLYHLSTDGRKLIIAALQTGAAFGALSLTGQQAQTSFAEVVEDSQIGVIAGYEIEQLLIQRPRIALVLLKMLGQRLVQCEAQLVDTAFKSTAARLAALLLHLAHQQGHSSVVEGLSHEELAERLGVYRETVSTALRELKDAGAITLGRKHITIDQIPLLQKLAQT
ncbi:MAG TPA: Crp/Fnr family transcriptional regulator [Ktedonobacteraceae bacterium]|nr:Crp/Fnr family transcriptional regulator [Ktedonobacteraceae bacterium]